MKKIITMKELITPPDLTKIRFHFEDTEGVDFSIGSNQEFGFANGTPTVNRIHDHAMEFFSILQFLTSPRQDVMPSVPKDLLKNLISKNGSCTINIAKFWKTTSVNDKDETISTLITASWDLHAYNNGVGCDMRVNRNQDKSWEVKSKSGSTTRIENATVFDITTDVSIIKKNKSDYRFWLTLGDGVKNPYEMAFPEIMYTIGVTGINEIDIWLENFTNSENVVMIDPLSTHILGACRRNCINYVVCSVLDGGIIFDYESLHGLLNIKNNYEAAQFNILLG